MLITSPFRIISNPGYALGVFVFGVLLAIPGCFQTGMINETQYLILEALFIFNLIAAALVFWIKKGPFRKKDFFSHDYYLKELNLKSNILYAISSGVLLVIGVPATFLFDVLATIYSITSLFNHPISFSIYQFTTELIWPYIYLLLFVLILTVLVILKEEIEKRIRN